VSAPLILYVLTEDRFFRSHFADRAAAAREAGYSVAVAARDTGERQAIEGAGFPFHPIPFLRGSLNPFAETGAVAALVRLYRSLRPALVHHVALKPVLYGTLAARAAPDAAIIHAPVGMGYIFTSDRFRARVLRGPVGWALRMAFHTPRSRTVLENADDLAALTASGALPKERAVLIRGAGVDVEAFRPSPEPEGPVTVSLVSRMLWDKGVAEFVDAARRLRTNGSTARFRLVGGPDGENPASIPAAQLAAWHEAGLVEWLGHRADIAAQMAGSHVVCLPSYREGLPKVLLEAMAAGRPVVATNVPGCREAVEPGVNGILVPPRDGAALAEALATLIDSPELRSRMGAAGRRRAETEFASARIAAETLDLYAAMLGRGRVPDAAA
jgi:glycosyltransferase involved in cell wall biosynthesis